MVQNGEISVNEFVYRTRPVLERSEFISNNIVHRNIKNIKNFSSPKEQSVKIFDAESVCKRKKRMEKIQQACKKIDKKEIDPAAASSQASSR